MPSEDTIHKNRKRNRSSSSAFTAGQPQKVTRHDGDTPNQRHDSDTPNQSLAPSAQQMFFTIPDLVAEVLGHLSIREVSICLYTSKTFRTSALLAHKVVPLHQFPELDDETKAQYVRTVIVPPVECCNPEMLEPAQGYNIFFKAPGEEDDDGSYGWAAVSGPSDNPYIFFGSPYPPPAAKLFHLVYGTTLSDRPYHPTENRIGPLPPRETPKQSVTLVFVPPYVSGEDDEEYADEDGLLRDPMCGAVLSAALFFSDRIIKVFGMELFCPFDDNEYLWATRHQRAERATKWFEALLEITLNDEEPWPYEYDVYDRLWPRVQFNDFIDLLFLPSGGAEELENVLDSLKIGEWRDKIDERGESQEFGW